MRAPSGKPPANLPKRAPEAAGATKPWKLHDFHRFSMFWPVSWKLPMAEFAVVFLLFLRVTSETNLTCYILVGSTFECAKHHRIMAAHDPRKKKNMNTQVFIYPAHTNKMTCCRKVCHNHKLESEPPTFIPL